MTVLYLLVPLALIFAAGALTVFIISVRRGQFDDLQTPPVRILMDDETVPGEGEKAEAPKNSSDA